MISMKRHFTLFITAASVLGLCLAFGCGHESGPVDEEHHEAGEDTDLHAHDEGVHEGAMLVVGSEEAHIELVHDGEAGEIILYITGPDGRTPLLLTDPPKVNLMAEGGNRQIETAAVNAGEGGASQFEARDEALKTEPLKGRIALAMNGKFYSVDIKDEHDHDEDTDH